jgi:pyridoxal phosphate enzyme (YggS family)
VEDLSRGAVDPAVAAAVASVRARIAAAAARAGRDPSGVALVAVTKTVDPQRVRAVLAAGVADLGENRAQELLAKVPPLADLGPAWHFIGRLQRNKVRALAPHVTWWHSIDRLELGVEVARRAPGARVLVEVNVGGEPQKGGCVPEALPGLVDGLRDAGLSVAGLMTVPPRARDPRVHFERLARLGADLGLEHLSMGMTDDFEAAVECGATIVRVGRALFGPRPAVEDMER